MRLDKARRQLAFFILACTVTRYSARAQLFESWRGAHHVSTHAFTGGVEVCGKLAIMPGWTLEAFENGVRRWEASLDQLQSRGVACDEGRVYVAEKGAYALDLQTGTEIWKSPLKGVAAFAAPTLAKGRLFVGSSEGHLYALEPRDGSIIWDVVLAYDSVPVTITGILETPDGLVVSGTRMLTDGRARAVVGLMMISTGKCRWIYEDPRASPRSGASDVGLYADGNVIIPDAMGNRLLALSLKDGSVKWTYHGKHADAGISSTPALTGGHLYAVSGDGSVLKMRTSDGSIEQRMTLPFALMSVGVCRSTIIVDGEVIGSINLNDDPPIFHRHIWDGEGSVFSKIVVRQGGLYVIGTFGIHRFSCN